MRANTMKTRTTQDSVGIVAAERSRRLCRYIKDVVGYVKHVALALPVESSTWTYLLRVKIAEARCYNAVVLILLFLSSYGCAAIVLLVVLVCAALFEPRIKLRAVGVQKNACGVATVIVLTC